MLTLLASFGLALAQESEMLDMTVVLIDRRYIEPVDPRVLAEGAALGLEGLVDASTGGRIARPSLSVDTRRLSPGVLEVHVVASDDGAIEGGDVRVGGEKVAWLPPDGARLEATVELAVPMGTSELVVRVRDEDGQESLWNGSVARDPRRSSP